MKSPSRRRRAFLQISFTVAAPAGMVETPHLDHPLASTLRHIAGIVTVISGVAGSLVSLFLWFSDSELPFPLDHWLPAPILSQIAFTIISASAAVGGILWLRGVHAGTALCSGTWAAVAALTARPGIRFNYSESAIPNIDIPSAGNSTVTIVVFVVSVALSALTHGFSGTTKHAHSRLHATLGETVIGAFFLVSGVVAAITFQLDSIRFGSIVIEKMLLPLTVGSIIIQALGLGILGGWMFARAIGIAILLALTGTAILPDLLFDKVNIPAPIFWSIAAAAGAVALLVPRRIHPPHHENEKPHE
ncbi:MAG: hypothetical protein ACKVS6_16335 [Planctomycetota bacterium]